ncbi:MAG: ArsA family ATPase [Acidimicrobiales bacterium]
MSPDAAAEVPPVDAALAGASVVLVMGAGGVGKTTLSAAMGVRASLAHGRRVLVVTVDPARRLADALGLAAMRADPVLVPTDGDGTLWTLMIDMASSWDRLVERHAPDAGTRDALLANRLYRTLTRRFVQSHDYIALDLLVEMADHDRYDLVVVDTPPSSHVLDVLDAPERMLDFLGSRFLTWLTAPYRSPITRAAAAPFLSVAERLLGGPFLADIAEFFWLFSSLRPGFETRARAVQDRLADPATRHVVVQSTDPASSAGADRLVAALAERGRRVDLRMVNRILPESVADEDAGGDPAVAAVVDEARRDHELLAALAGQSVPVVSVPWSRRPVGDLDGLAALVEPVEPGIGL